MNQKNNKVGTRAPLLISALALLACAGVCIFLYATTRYLPVLMAGILQALPAVLNLLLLLPKGKPQEEPPAEKAEKAAAEGEETPPKKKKRLRALWQWLLHLPGRGCRWLSRLWSRRRSAALAVLILVCTAGANVVFWLMMQTKYQVYGLGYHMPVAMIVIFTVYVILDKWCEHAERDDRESRQTEEEKETAVSYDCALLHSLRGAMAVGRWASLVLMAQLMLCLMNIVEWVTAATVVVAVFFVYETAFLLISLAVRLIRREMDKAPELSIPMPGLGGEDLGIISYLEKNTGMTMRSLWSIRLIKGVLPYTVMAIVLLTWGFSGMVQIEAHQEGAHYRLGKLREETLQPGLHMTLPWPFDTVEVYDTEVVSNMTIGYVSEENTDNVWTDAHGRDEYRLLLGGGNELISINMRVAYRIDDLKAYLASSTDPESLLQAAAYETVTAKTISSDLNTLLATDRAAFAKSFQADLTERIARYNTGLTVVDVVLESIHPPIDIADVYQQLVSAGIEAERIVMVAESLARVEITNAEGDQYITIGQARAASLLKIAAANAAVAEIMAAVESEAEWTEAERDYYQYRYLQAISKAYADATVVIVGDGVNAIIVGDILGSLVTQ